MKMPILLLGIFLTLTSHANMVSSSNKKQIYDRAKKNYQQQGISNIDRSTLAYKTAAMLENLKESLEIAGISDVTFDIEKIVMFENEKSGLKFPIIYGSSKTLACRVSGRFNNIAINCYSLVDSSRKGFLWIWHRNSESNAPRIAILSQRRLGLFSELIPSNSYQSNIHADMPYRQ